MELSEKKILEKINNISPCGKHSETSSRIYFDLIRSSLIDEVIDDMWEYSKIPKFYKYFEFAPFKSKEETYNYLKKLILRKKKQAGVYWFIRLRKNNKVIGTFGLAYWDLSKKRTQIGYGISPHYWGKGYFSEALESIVNYCFNVLGLERIEAHTRWDNSGSIRGLKKNGFKYEGRLRNYHLRFDGTRHDVMIFGIIKKGFKTLKK